MRTNSEVRSPSPERRHKPEDRTVALQRSPSRHVSQLTDEPRFGYWISAFFWPSGIRISDLGSLRIPRPVLILLAAACLALLVEIQPAFAAENSVAVEALSRLKDIDLEANPNVKTAVLRVLETTRGTPQFVQIVRQFKLAGQEEGLLQVAIAEPSGDAGADAIRLLLASANKAPLTNALAGADAPKVVEALGSSGDKLAAVFLLPMTADASRTAALRQAAVIAAVRTQDGANGLLQLGREGKLPDDTRAVAAAELAGTRWPEIKAEAAKVFASTTAAPATATMHPPIAELVKVAGDAARGRKVLERPTSLCLNCHKIRDEGRDVGPALGEIGAKLGKDALFQSILEPSAGIAFGYEAWTFETKAGDEFYGLLVSETADDVSVKDVSGVVNKLKKSDVVRRTQSKLSIMPDGIAGGMTIQDFADLVEYLATLRPAK